MSTARLEPRRIQPRRERTIATVRRPLTLAAVCGVIFTCAFVLGRGGGTTAATPREGAQWAVAVVAAGSAIPASLGSAPPIEVEAPPARARGTLAGSQAGTAGRTTLAERLVTEAPTASVPPHLPAPVSAPAPQVPTPPAAPAPRTSPSAGSPTPKTGSPAGGGSPTIAHPGESFDTSG
ncbi:MAG TPA: hypothetical protein VGO14_00400 [Solirubrobacteraceae bacterium]|jgi:hypothetical protein|nr:hypothetical protein [Solirubrobacteraceae bacterium]